MSSCCSSSSRSGTVNTERFSPSICLHEEEKPANKVKKHIDGESYHDLNLETIATLITVTCPPNPQFLKASRLGNIEEDRRFKGGKFRMTFKFTMSISASRTLPHI